MFLNKVGKFLLTNGGNRKLISSSINAAPKRNFSRSGYLFNPDKVSVTFVFPESGEKVKATTNVGENLLDVVLENNIDIDGFGACEGTLACSTCHLIFQKKDFDNIEDEITDEELDMLDLAYGLEETSRLGCQVCMTKKLDGIEVRVPAGIVDNR